jgi:hypothetical protein
VSHPARVAVVLLAIVSVAADLDRQAALVRAEEPGAAGPTASGWFDAWRRHREALTWTDEAVRHDWRLQRREGTAAVSASGGSPAAACRLLDPRDGVIREGTAEECQAALEALTREGTVPLVRGHTVIVLHGLGEGRDSMRPLVDYLRQAIEANVLLFGYASVKADIDTHGASLGRVIAGLPEADTISFVGHSLGNIIVRRWMALAAADDLARTGRMVMLGPPNQGSELARLAAQVRWLADTADGAARDLVCDWPRVESRLVVPPCPFGIVAGGKGDGEGFSRLLTGDDDAVVRVEETRLPGASDFLLLPVHHALMMKHPEVQRATAAFLTDGWFPRAANGAAANGAAADGAAADGAAADGAAAESEDAADDAAASRAEDGATDAARAAGVAP